MLYYAGIDVGKHGAVAIISFKDRLAHPKIEVIHPFAKHTPSETASFFRCWGVTGLQSSIHPLDGCVLENVNSSPQMGVTSAFTFGRGRGFLEGCLETAQIPYDLIVPTVWETALKCRSGGKKNVTRAKAQSLFGNQFSSDGIGTPMKGKITNDIADALLIALYCSKRERGLL